MATRVEGLATRLQERFGTQLLSVLIDRGQVTAEIDGQHLPGVATRLRDDDDLAFRQLTDLCGIDYLAWGRADWVTRRATDAGFSRAVAGGARAEGPPVGKARFAVVYHLLSIEHNQRLRLRAFPAPDTLAIPSAVELWPAAGWYEREAFDLFGILFDGHPDLRRLLTDYGFIGHPFRKDFPLEGHVEVRYDPARRRVVYQPVTIENRVLVPRVIRDDTRHDAAPPHA